MCEVCAWSKHFRAIPLNVLKGLLEGLLLLQKSVIIEITTRLYMVYTSLMLIGSPRATHSQAHESLEHAKGTNPEVWKPATLPKMDDTLLCTEEPQSTFLLPSYTQTLHFALDTLLYNWLTLLLQLLSLFQMGKTARYELLNVIDFTSERKRMSVIIKDEKGTIRLMCKGAVSRSVSLFLLSSRLCQSHSYLKVDSMSGYLCVIHG